MTSPSWLLSHAWEFDSFDPSSPQHESFPVGPSRQFGEPNSHRRETIRLQLLNQTCRLIEIDSSTDFAGPTLGEVFRAGTFRT
jgi:hypothetical protein